MFNLRQTRGSTPTDPSVLPKDSESGQYPNSHSGSAAAAAVVPRTRNSSGWIGLSTAIVVFIALIVFILQNMHTMQISFLGLHGTLPAAVALLIAMGGGVALGMGIGAARIIQLRRSTRGRRS